MRNKTKQNQIGRNEMLMEINGKLQLNGAVNLNEARQWTAQQFHQINKKPVMMITIMMMIHLFINLRDPKAEKKRNTNQNCEKWRRKLFTNY